MRGVAFFVGCSRQLHDGIMCARFTSHSHAAQGAELLWSAGDAALRVAVMQTISRYTAPQPAVAADAVVHPVQPPPRDATLGPALSTSSLHIKPLLPVLNRSVSATEAPPQQPTSRSLFQRHLKIKKEKPVSAAAATALMPSAPAQPRASFDPVTDACPAVAADAISQVANAEAGTISAASVLATDAHQDTTEPTDHGAPNFTGSHAAAASVASAASHVEDITNAPACGKLFALQRLSEHSVERVPSPGDGSYVATEIEQQESDRKPVSDVTDDGVSAPRVGSAASDHVSEAAAAVMRISESVGHVEMRWRGAVGRGADVENDLKMLRLAEDQVIQAKCFLFIIWGVYRMILCPSTNTVLSPPTAAAVARHGP